ELNKKREAELNEELKEMLEFSIEMMEETEGYFNPFIGRLSHLWKESLAEGKLVEDKIIQEELLIMNETTLELDGSHAKLIGDGNLDLGGVAKGYATSRAQEYLDSIDCHSYLLNAGSSNIVLGNKNGKDFTVGLSKATGTGYFETFTLKERSISTSSIKEQQITIDGKIYSHLLNPMTGYPAMEYDTLSIIGFDSKVLDAYSTAGFAMELEELKSFLEEKGLEFIVSKENKTLYKSAGIKAYEKD
ncbi:MAG: FAD:protein FMN transferase, partial [Anaeroplasmataceae bacterium]|nr:FAD:protein FMN transferase [Anaeroplasmataceae bacterium]